MFYKDSSNNKYYLGRAFDYGDIQYAAGAATHAKFTELGFTQVIVGSRPNDKFYVVSGPDINGNYASSPRDLNQLKVQFIISEKLNAKSLLAPSDWYLVRKEETGDAVPVTWTNYRAAVRTANAARCNEIAAAADIAALETLMTATAEIPDPSNPGSMMVNSDALTAYPALLDEEASVTADYGL